LDFSRLQASLSAPQSRPMATGNYQDIKTWLCRLYADDPRPWLVGFSGGKDSTNELRMSSFE
jgi:3'-phosphoadenosine 5'-phosphosulfate sulfotransferase (PAPS reductase)/FAD synthetase